MRSEHEHLLHADERLRQLVQRERSRHLRRIAAVQLSGWAGLHLREYLLHAERVLRPLREQLRSA